MHRGWKVVSLWGLLLIAGCQVEGDGSGSGLCAHVACVADGPCHSAGTCDPETGQCSTPSVANGTACTLAHASGACSAGSCEVTSCSSGFGDCDHLASNGCEADLSSPGNCGACGDVCPGGESASCVAGECAPIGCTTDDVSGIAKSGWISVGYSKDFVPLCSGEVILGDTAKNQLIRKDVPRDTFLAAYGLAGTPGALVFDAGHGYLHTALANSTVVRLELSTGAIATVPVPAEPLHLAVGKHGQLFASLQGKSSLSQQVAIIDGIGARLQRTLTSDFGDLLVFDRQHDKLITGNSLITPSSLRRYAFDPDELTLTREDNLREAGGNCHDLAISPDGNRLAHACGGGNRGYDIADFSPMNFSSIAGYWETGPYPSAVAFSPDGRLVAASDGVKILVFDAETHALLDTYSPVGCSPYGQLFRVGFSRGGRIVFSLTACGFYRDSSIINWFVR